jgi:hypothetical protein
MTSQNLSRDVIGLPFEASLPSTSCLVAPSNDSTAVNVNVIAPRVSNRTLELQRAQAARPKQIEAAVVPQRTEDDLRRQSEQRLADLGGEAIPAFRKMRAMEVERLASGLSEFAVQQLSEMLDPLNVNNTRRHYSVPAGQAFSGVVYQGGHFKARNARGVLVKMSRVESLANMNPYEILNISPSTSFVDIGKAKEQLLIILDPHVLLKDSEDGKPQADVCAAHMLVHAAFEVIRDELSGKASGNAMAILAQLKHATNIV